jgi:sRNA-binding regulator protein Hfq
MGEIKERMGRSSRSHSANGASAPSVSNGNSSSQATGSASVPQGNSGGRRRIAPPEQTNAESYYYLKQMQAKTPMVIVLQDGEKIRGIIEWYDKHCLKISCQKHPNILLPKHNIKYIFKQEEEPRVRRTRNVKRDDGIAEGYEMDASHYD